MSNALNQLSDLLNLGYSCKQRSFKVMADPNVKSDITLTLTKDSSESKTIVIKHSEIPQANYLLESHNQHSI